MVLELIITPEGKRIAKVHKDRTNTLPPTFEYSYEAFVEYMGIEGLEREPVVINQKAALDQKAGRNCVITFDGTEIKTAGVNADNLEKLKNLASTFGNEELQLKLREDYLIDSLLDLKNDEAELLIKDINNIINTKND